MDDTLYLLITIVRTEDMELLQYVHVSKWNTAFGQNYMFWMEPEVAAVYAEIFDYDEQVTILKVETINGIK